MHGKSRARFLVIAGFTRIHAAIDKWLADWMVHDQSRPAPLHLHRWNRRALLICARFVSPSCGVRNDWMPQLLRLPATLLTLTNRIGKLLTSRFREL